MTDTSSPSALTPDEWRLLKLWTAGKMPGGKVRGKVVLDLPESHKHGAAACALYGEPFGFSAEDVAELLDLATSWDEEAAISESCGGGSAYRGEFQDQGVWGKNAESCHRRAAKARSLASRIQSLLPPPEFPLPPDML